jgi:hypothetical protein
VSVDCGQAGIGAGHCACDDEDVIERSANAAKIIKKLLMEKSPYEKFSKFMKNVVNY